MTTASEKAKAWLEYHGHKRCGFLPEDDTASLAALLEAYGDERLEEAAKVADAEAVAVLQTYEGRKKCRALACSIRALKKASHDAGAGRE